MELRCATRKGLARPSAVSSSTYQDVTISIIRGQFISHLHSFLHFIQEIDISRCCAIAVLCQLSASYLAEDIILSIILYFNLKCKVIKYHENKRFMEPKHTKITKS